MYDYKNCISSRLEIPLMSWLENSKIIDQMIKGSSGELWGHRLETSSHFPLLNNILNHIGQNGLLIDLGCGAGDVSRIWKDDYLGADLSWVIEKVSKICNPSAQYISINIKNDSLEILPRCRCVLMNAFLDVQENPFSILEKVCCMNTEWVVVHRQRVQNIEKSTFQYVKSYGDSQVPSSIISFAELNEIKNKYSKEFLIQKWENDSYSFAMRIK